jgi:hypothetical protein
MSPATFGLASPDCKIITDAVQRIFSHPTRAVMTEVPSRDSCSYNFHDTKSQNSKDKTIVVTLYGERGEPISSYQRPRNFSWRSLPELGQLAEYIELPGIKKAIVVLYRNNRRVLEIDYFNCFPNPAIEGANQLIGSLLGSYKAQDAPLSEPKGPPK